MADFSEGVKASPSLEGVEGVKCVDVSTLLAPVDFECPTSVIYCGVCSMPIEYCEYGSCLDKCKAWQDSALDEDELAEQMDKAVLGDDEDEDGDEEEDGDKKKKKKTKKVKVAKTTKVIHIEDAKVVIARIQRQKRKFVTAVAGLESVPDLKIKDAAKTFGKKFASGAAVSETASGSKEVVIQGDVCYDLPALLVNVFKIPKKAIFFLEDGKLRRAIEG